MLWAWGFEKYINPFVIFLCLILAIIVLGIYLSMEFLGKREPNKKESEMVGAIKHIKEIWYTQFGEEITYMLGKARSKNYVDYEGKKIKFTGFLFQKYQGDMISVIYDWGAKDIFEYDDDPSPELRNNPIHDFNPYIYTPQKRDNDKQQVGIIPIQAIQKEKDEGDFEDTKD